MPHVKLIIDSIQLTKCPDKTKVQPLIFAENLQDLQIVIKNLRAQRDVTNNAWAEGHPLGHQETRKRERRWIRLNGHLRMDLATKSK